MPIISVQMLSGRTTAQKSAFIERLALVAIEALGVPESAVRVVLTEVPATNWGVGVATAEAFQAGVASHPPI